MSCGRASGAVAIANDAHWRLVAHGDKATLSAPIVRAQMGLFAGAVVVLVAIIGSLTLVSRSIQHRITSPAAALAGEEVVLAKEGKPLVRLTPVENRKNDKLSTLGMLKGKIWIDDDHFDDPLPDDILRGFGVID